MEKTAARRWCPQCQQLGRHAPLPLMADEGQRLRQLAEQVQGLAHRYYCENCRAIWQAVEVPEELLQRLLAAQEENRKLRHQVAMLRLLAAQAESPDQPGTVPPGKAA